MYEFEDHEDEFIDVLLIDALDPAREIYPLSFCGASNRQIRFPDPDVNPLRNPIFSLVGELHRRATKLGFSASYQDDPPEHVIVVIPETVSL